MYSLDAVSPHKTDVHIMRTKYSVLCGEKKKKKLSCTTNGTYTVEKQHPDMLW